jgi:choline dehydrogenase-like flavoprotein
MGAFVTALLRPFPLIQNKEGILKDQYDVIIVGSGAAGGTLAYQLSQVCPDKRILLIEKGGVVKEGEAGKFWPFFLKYYRRLVLGSRSKEGVIIYAGEMLGGTTVISCGNMVRSPELERRFYELGVDDLNDYFAQAENQLGVKALPAERIMAGSATITSAAGRLGLLMAPMPKAVKTTCDNCGNCVKGCHRNAKWDVRAWIKQASAVNVDVVRGTVKKVLRHGDKAIGVQLTTEKYFSHRVVLAAGALNTPQILLRSGIDAGRGLSIHPFEVVYGKVIGESRQTKGISMAAYYKPVPKILLSPFLDEKSQMFFACGSKWILKNSREKLLGIMVKVADPEANGRVYANGISYQLPAAAQRRLDKGYDLAQNILLKAGCQIGSIVRTAKFPRGAHPQGTAKIGEVVDRNLRVYKMPGLYVSDASILPLATGTPPILTLVALNLRLARHLDT